jgi:molybdate transport system ATP-binding protein
LAEVLSRTDLALASADDAGVVLQARVIDHDSHYGLTRLGVTDAELWVGAVAQAPGTLVRVRVLARDVSVVRSAPGDSSIVNVLPVTLMEFGADRATALLGLALGHGASVADRLRAPRLLARITRRSLDTLALRPGDALYAQIKGVSLMR